MLDNLWRERASRRGGIGRPPPALDASVQHAERARLRLPQLGDPRCENDVPIPKPPSDLVLIRLATIYFDRLDESWNTWSLTNDDVEVRALDTASVEDGTRQLVAALRRLEYRPKLTSEGGVVVPAKARREAEAGIDHAADLIAVTQVTRRSVSSAWPPVALFADGDEGREWLQRARFFDFSGEGQEGNSSMTWSVELTDEVQQGLQDRLDGVALLAEALAHRHATGRFHEFMRLFERGFATPSSRLAGPLTALLDPKFGYTEDEVQYWTETLRDPATHADVRPSFVVESETRPVIGRMRQAAYDVLFNKQSWRSPDTERRALWSPPAGTTSGSGNMFVVQGSTGIAMQHQLTDPFGEYPLDLSAGLSSLPDGWWFDMRPEAEH
jgi:hypothetical protein